MGSLCRPHLFCAQYLVIISSIANPETDEVHLLQTEIVLHYPGMAVTRADPSVWILLLNDNTLHFSSEFLFRAPSNGHITPLEERQGLL